MYTTLPAIDNYTYCHSITGNITRYFCLLLRASNNAKGNEYVMNTTCIFMWQTQLIWKIKNIMRIIWSLFWWSHEGAELNPWNLIESVFFFLRPRVEVTLNFQWRSWRPRPRPTHTSTSEGSEERPKLAPNSAPCRRHWDIVKRGSEWWASILTTQTR